MRMVQNTNVNQNFSLRFFRRSDILTEKWFSELDQFILSAYEDCKVTFNLDVEFERQPGVIAFWYSVLSELDFIKGKLESSMRELEGQLVVKFLEKANVNLTYRLIDLICFSDKKYKAMEKNLRRIGRAKSKVEGILTALDHKRSSLNYFAKLNLASRNSI